jgi:hypothetical protein
LSFLDQLTPPPALLSTTPVGIAPDGAQPFSHKSFIAVANTNRFDSCPGAGGTVSILEVNKGCIPRRWVPSSRRETTTDTRKSIELERLLKNIDFRSTAHSISAANSNRLVSRFADPDLEL